MNIIKGLGAVIISLASAVFVHAYSFLKANEMVYLYKMNLSIIPLPTFIFHNYSFLGYIIPAALLIATIILKQSKTNNEKLSELIITISMSLTVLWVFASVLAWQLLVYYPVAVIE